MTPISLTTTEEIDGCIRLNPTWAGLDGVARLDLVQDWLAVLEQLRRRCHYDLYQGKTGDIYEFKTLLMESIRGWDNHAPLDPYTE
jgi:hypothetical protein